MKGILSFALVCLTLVSFSNAVCAQAAATAAQVVEFDVNGMKVLVKRRAGMPTVAAGLFIKGGTRELTKQQAGVEDFMLNAAVEGSRQFPRTSLRRELAQTGSVIRPGTNYDYSVLSMISTLEHFERTWKIFTDIALDPLFAESDVELTRQRLLALLQSREDNPEAILQMLVDRTILAGTPYGEDPSGTRESIARLTAADLRAHHKKVMTTSRLLLVVVGDVDAETMKRLTTPTFGKLARGEYKPAPVPALDFSKPTLDVTKRSLQTNYINGIFPAPNLNHPDYYAMRVAMSILQNRIFREVREKRNLSYSPNANLGMLEANTGAIYVTSVDANQSIQVITDEIRRLQREPVSEDEISATAGQFLTTHFLAQETNAAQVGDLALYELIGGGWRNNFKFLERVREVKPADIQTVATKYIKNLRYFVVGDPAAIDRNIFLQAF